MSERAHSRIASADLVRDRDVWEPSFFYRKTPPAYNTSMSLILSARDGPHIWDLCSITTGH